MFSYTTATILLKVFWILPVVLGGIYLGISLTPRCFRACKDYYKKRFKEKVPYNLNEFWFQYKDGLFANIIGKRKIKKIPLRIIILVVYVFIGIILQLRYQSIYFYSKPNVIFSNANSLDFYTDEKSPITVYFDKPIDISTLKVNAAPEGFDINVQYHSPYESIVKKLNYIFDLHLKSKIITGVSILPEQSIPYDTGVIYYITGIKSLKGNGDMHEEAITLKTPVFPTSVVSSISDKQKDTPVTNPIIFTFDQPILKSLYYKIQFTPQVNFSINKADSTHLEILPNEPLKQGTSYEMTLSIATRNVNLKTTEEEVTTDLQLLSDITFKTVASAGIKDILPTGNSVLPTSPIQITFSEPMVDSSVLENLSIEPYIKYSATWIKEHEILELNFDLPFEKATKYTLTLKKNAQSLRGGILGKDLINQFETIGYVKVIKHNPSANSKNNSTFTKIQFTFDQQVDKESAQKSFSISPPIAVSYSWKGNTLTVSPKKPLKYTSKYSVLLKPGIKSIYGFDSNKSESFSFTTRSQVVTINVPSYKQGYGTFDCNLVSLQMALAAKGVSASVSAMKSSIGYGTPYNESTHTGGNPNNDWIDHYGVHWDPVAKYARSRGRTADVHRGWSLSGIAKEINRGNPVVIFWYNGLSDQTRYSWHYTYGARPGLHSVVAYGYRGEENNPTGFYIRDPWPSFYVTYYSSGSFLSKWSYFGYTAVVIK